MASGEPVPGPVPLPMTWPTSDARRWNDLERRLAEVELQVAGQVARTVRLSNEVRALRAALGHQDEAERLLRQAKQLEREAAALRSQAEWTPRPPEVTWTTRRPPGAA